MSKLVKNLIIIIIAIAAAVAVSSFDKVSERKEVKEPAVQPNDGVIIEKYNNAELGLSFAYRKEPDGYTLVEYENSGYEPELIKSFSIFNTQVHQSFLEAVAEGAATEGPTSISIRIYENKNNLSPRDWAEVYRTSNSTLAITPIEDIVFGGAPAVQYGRDGLYMGTVIVVSNNSKIYVIDNSLVDTLSPDTQKDSEEIINSFLFF